MMNSRDDPFVSPEELHVSCYGYSLERRWMLQFFIGILICVVNSACFCFGVFSPYLKMGGFQYSQSQVNVIATVGVVLSYFSIPSGFLYDSKGPAMTLLVGTILNAVGWLGMYSVFARAGADDSGPTTSVVLICFVYGLCQLSASFYESSAILTNLKAFSCYQGRVVLIQKTFMGLGTSIVAQIFAAFFTESYLGVAGFFLMLACYGAVAGLLGVWQIRLPTLSTQCVGLNVDGVESTAKRGGEPLLFLRPFYVGTFVLLVIVCFTLAVTLTECFVQLGAIPRILIGLATVVLVLSFSAMIFSTRSFVVNVNGYVGALGEENNDGEEEKHGGAVVATHHSCGPPLDSQPLSHIGGISDAVNAVEQEKDNADRAPRHMTLLTESEYALNSASLWTNMQHRELWLLWYICFASWGTMTLVSSNSAQIYGARAGDAFSLTVNTALVSVFGAGSAVGRIAVGVCHPRFRRNGTPVACFLILAAVVNVISLPLLVVLPNAALVVPLLGTGLAGGLSWGCTVLVVTSLFATGNCGKHYSFLYTAGMLSPLLFNIVLFAPNYDYYSKQQGGDTERNCVGVICVLLPVLVCTVLNVGSTVTACYLVRRLSQRGGIVSGEPQ